MVDTLPEREARRLAAVQRYDILDTPPDGAFDRVTSLAARVFNVPIAIVSIVDHDRIWFKSHHGLDVQQLDRDPGLCASAIMQTEPWIIKDAKLDPRALANPLVAGEFGLRFYAAAPLTTSEGHNLGTLCIIDKEPREFSDDEAKTLQDLASIVIDALELRIAARNTVHRERTVRQVITEEKDNAEALAQALQTSLLPPHMPHIPGVDLAALYSPADRAVVGGDFYDIIPIADEVWGIAIGDICGKGAKAAARTALARYTIRAAAIQETSPAKVLSLLNAALLKDSEESSQFCTVCFAVLSIDPKDPSLTIASAGHPLPLIFGARGGVKRRGTPGVVAGAFEDSSYTDTHVSLRRGDRALFYTDGLTEARVGEKLFGLEPVLKILRRSSNIESQQIIERIRAALVAEGAQQRDDIALVSLRVS